VVFGSWRFCEVVPGLLLVSGDYCCWAVPMFEMLMISLLFSQPEMLVSPGTLASTILMEVESLVWEGRTRILSFRAAFRRASEFAFTTLVLTGSGAPLLLNDVND